MTDFPENPTAILTGAASERGIGRAAAHYLAERGWSIGIIDIDDAGAKEAATAIADAHGVTAAGVGADVADAASVSRAVDELAGALPQIVALVNLAGVSSPVPYLEVSAEEWDRVISINLTGVHYVTHAVVPHMVENRLGRVVNISSVSAQRGGGTYSKTPYSASKAGVIGFTRSVARELGEYDITVNAISPGPIDTDIMGGTLTDERKAEMAVDLLTNRIGTPRDIAAAIHFLIGPDAGYITGQTVNVDGGLYLH